MISLLTSGFICRAAEKAGEETRALFKRLAICVRDAGVSGLISGDEGLDLEQHVQCFWSALLLDLPLVVAFVDSHRPAEGDGATSELFEDGLAAALTSSLVVLVGCRIIFMLMCPVGFSL